MAQGKTIGGLGVFYFDNKDTKYHLVRPILAN